MFQGSFVSLKERERESTGLYAQCVVLMYRLKCNVSVHWVIWSSDVTRDVFALCCCACHRCAKRKEKACPVYVHDPFSVFMFTFLVFWKQTNKKSFKKISEKQFWMLLYGYHLRINKEKGVKSHFNWSIFVLHLWNSTLEHTQWSIVVVDSW